MLRPRRMRNSIIIVPWILYSCVILLAAAAVLLLSAEAHQQGSDTTSNNSMLLGASRGGVVRGLFRHSHTTIHSRSRTTLGCFVASSSTPRTTVSPVMIPITRSQPHHHPYSCTAWMGFRTDIHNSLSPLTGRLDRNVEPFHPHGPASGGKYDSNMRLFGTKGGTLDSVGDIQLIDEQTALPNLDIQRIKDILTIVRDIIGYPTYDVTLILVDDKAMRATNLESRDMDSPTDILSFPFDDDIVEPGNLGDPEFDVPDYYHLGDMFLDVEYVVRQCKQDKKDSLALVTPPNEAEDAEYESSSDSDDEYEYVDDDRGVAGTMMTIYDPEERIGLLLVHGMLHLVGYDHIEDDEYEQMITREDDVLAILKERLKK
mmetsp:Transcript_15380/g.27915  ORF Transcript_15380/g.27915 Transcript_15380/m.27915 type:complete len:372 (-) Transcript_15380:76-1191(-)